ncbi:MAG: maleylpyruvate isomerase family mycothiol-dependent enzyme [Propioniciclava sp.]
MLSILNQGQVDPVLKRIADATQLLLGQTISITDDQWHQASVLPGWSRAHVASHIARNADALRVVVSATMAGDPTPMYPSSNAKYNAIERGAERDGLELQVDLDTSAGELARLCERVPDWLMPVKLLGGAYPLAVITLIRLQEVTMHHLDLDCGFTWEGIDIVPARWLFGWITLLMRDDASLPAIDLESASGETASLGGVGERRTVTGPDAALWAWLIGRTAGDGLTGAAGITFPLAG